MERKMRCEVKWVVRENPFKTHFDADENIPNVLYRMSSELAKKHNIRGKLLDVGPGANREVMASLQDIGVKSHSIDRLKITLKELKEKKVRLAKKDELGKHYGGDILNIHHENSEIKNKKFDYITFWGSWVGQGTSGTDNQNFDHNMIITLMENGVKEEDYQKFTALLKENALRACKYALNPNGKIAIISTRYAWHGGRTNTIKMPYELREHQKVISWFKKLGAKKIHVYARSWEWADKQVDAVCKTMEKRITGKEMNLDVVPEKLMRLEKPSVEGIKQLSVTKMWKKMKIARDEAVKAVKQYINGEISKGDAVNKMTKYRPINDNDRTYTYLDNLSGWRKIMRLRNKVHSPLIDAIVAEF